MEHQPGSNLPQPTLSTFSSQSLELLRENTMINTELDLDPLEEPNDLPISRNVSLTWFWLQIIAYQAHSFFCNISFNLIIHIFN